MDHVAIMDKKFGFIPKILNGQKSIESRWYIRQSCPWDKIREKDTVYFKNSGESISTKAPVSKVLQFMDLTPNKVNDLLIRFGENIGLTSSQLPSFESQVRHKKYVILVFLEKPELIEPFNIDKTGFGAMSAWICVEDINNIRR